MLGPAMKARQTGFTLIELMFTIVVLGVLLGIGIPNFRDFLRSSRISGATNDIVTDLSAARSEAVKRRVPVTLCKSRDGATCEEDNDPFDRWIIFVDDADPAAVSANDGNGAVNGGEQVLRRREVASSITVKVNANARRIVYRPSGFPDNAAANTVSQFVLCDQRGNNISVGGVSAARAVTISTTGRPAATRDKTKIAGLGGC
jgi:type IV fimbrial biogenesis protein FimT